eukprot:scaffold1474_cov256-Pinguiococcus_pyrenoidosus.AAC.23
MTQRPTVPVVALSDSPALPPPSAPESLDETSLPLYQYAARRPRYCRGLGRREQTRLLRRRHPQAAPVSVQKLLELREGPLAGLAREPHLLENCRDAFPGLHIVHLGRPSRRRRGHQRNASLQARRLHARDESTTNGAEVPESLQEIPLLLCSLLAGGHRNRVSPVRAGGADKASKPVGAVRPALTIVGCFVSKAGALKNEGVAHLGDAGLPGQPLRVLGVQSIHPSWAPREALAAPKISQSSGWPSIKALRPTRVSGFLLVDRQVRAAPLRQPAVLPLSGAHENAGVPRDAAVPVFSALVSL